jgi:putative transposase
LCESTAVRRSPGGRIIKKSRFTEEQIVGMLREHERGAATDELCRRRGISQQTLYRWKAKYGFGVSDAQRLKVLEDENRRLKKLVAEQALDNAALKDVLSRNW